jgi:hypothetical protein
MTPAFTIAGAVTRTTSLTGAVTLSPVLAGDIARLRLLVGALTFSPTIAGNISVGVSQALSGTIALPVAIAGNMALLFTEIPGIGHIAHVRTGHQLASHRGRIDKIKEGVVN